MKRRANIHKCDGSIIVDLDVISERKFSITFQSDALPVRLWTLQEKLGNGVYGTTFLATSNNDEVFVSQSIAVKATLPKYDIQEYEIQHHLACRWNEELKRLPRRAAIFPEVYFIGLYDPLPTSLTLFKKAGISVSVVAGMERLDCTLQKTLGDLLKNPNPNKNKEIKRLVNKAIVSVANTLQEVNKEHNMFVHGDLHDGNIMHDESKENFYIVDFGKARINSNETEQSLLPEHSFYKSAIAAGSRGLDLLTLCLSLVEYIDHPSIELNDTYEEKGLLSHLWYPLWNFFRLSPRGDYSPFELRDNMNQHFSISQFLDPKGKHFLATGCKTKKSWPHFIGVEDEEVLETNGTPRTLKRLPIGTPPTTKKLHLAHIFGYTAGDGDEHTLTFKPEEILSNNPVTDPAFMLAMRVYFTKSFHMIMMLNRVEEEENRRASLCAQMSCVVSYMPQFHTFTLND
jgi:serine/threonine protein kinase